MSGARPVGGDGQGGTDGGEAAPSEAAPSEEGEQALRLRELLVRVREANRLSRNGPDSPSLGRRG